MRDGLIVADFATDRALNGSSTLAIPEIGAQVLVRPNRRMHLRIVSTKLGVSSCGSCAERWRTLAQEACRPAGPRRGPRSVAGDLATVDVQDLAGDERRRLQEQDAVDDVADLAHVPERGYPRRARHSFPAGASASG